MPTIAEIIAAKKAKAAPASATKETITERIENDALDARLAPVKPAVATAARKMAGLVLNRNMPVTKPEPAIAMPPEERALSVTNGEVIDRTPAGADPVTAAWHSAMCSLESELCVMRDPTDPEACWLALRSAGPVSVPLLLHRLPWLLWEHPHQSRPDNEPY
jgi:hypothetical protein